MGKQMVTGIYEAFGRGDMAPGPFPIPRGAGL